jgi:HSP20 family protein
MLTQWDDFSRTLNAFDEFRRRINRAFEDVDYPRRAFQTTPWGRSNWPLINLFDEGTKLLLEAEVPGLSEKEINLSLNQNILSITGERAISAPKDYAVHRQERSSIKFSRSFSLPCKIDTEKVMAEVKDGFLIVTMEKAKEAQPRQITIKAS